METTEVMSSVLASVSTRREKAAKAMAALHSHRNVITACITEWENLERSFGVTERALQQKFKELPEREVEFDAKMQEARAALDKREESIAGREETSLARVKEQKDTAIAAIAEELRKLDEERTKWRAEKGVLAPAEEEAEGQGKYAGKDDGHTKTPLKDAYRTLSKETKQVQPKKGSAADLSTKNVHDERVTPSRTKAEIKTGLQKKDAEIKDGKRKGEQQEDTSKNKRKDVIVADESAVKRRKQEAEPAANATAAGSKKGNTLANTPSLEEAITLVKNVEDAPTPIQIKDLVDKRDYEGLKEFFANHKKELKNLRPELQAALQSSGDPCRFTLKILESSEGVDKIFVNNKSGNACVVLLECLSEVVADPVLGVDFPVVPSDVKEIARSIARRWKSLLEAHSEDGFGVASHLFLQLLATFGTGTDYSADDLLRYVIAMSRRGIGPAICRSLGLTDKIPVVVDRLLKEGKQIDAIAYASTFGLVHKYNPGVLLKSYIEDSQKVLDTEKASSIGGNMAELYSKQIVALRHAIKVLVDYKLESQLPVEDLRNRMAALKQERAAIRKGNSNSKPENENDRAPEELQSGRPNDASNKIDVAGTRLGFNSAHEMSGSYISSLERGHYVPTDLGRANRVDYTPTDIGRPLFPPYDLDRLNRRPESTYDSYGLGGRSPVSLSSSNPYASRDSIGSYPGGPSSALPGFHTYTRMSRDDSEMLLGFSASRGILPYPETRGPSSNYQLGGGLPSSSTYLPHYLR